MNNLTVLCVLIKATKFEKSQTLYKSFFQSQPNDINKVITQISELFTVAIHSMVKKKKNSRFVITLCFPDRIKMIKMLSSLVLNLNSMKTKRLQISVSTSPFYIYSHSLKHGPNAVSV